MDFFDLYGNFSKGVPGKSIGGDPKRLRHRYDAIIGANRALLRDARVLDIASYDGRWAFAAIDAGATHVTCIEFEEQFAARIRENFESYGGVDSYELYVGDVHEQIREFSNDHFDVVLCLGFFYHTSQHVTLAQEMCRVSKKHIILDTRISNRNFSGIELKTEDSTSIETGKRFGEKGDSVVGLPTKEALTMMFGNNGYELSYFPWDNFKLDGATRDYRNGRRVTLVATRREYGE